MQIPSTHFERLNAIVASGMLGKLSGPGLRVWLAYESHAGADGQCWPSLRRIAKLAGLRTEAQVCRARKELILAGLMRRLEEGGGRGHSSKYEMTLSEVSSAPSALDSDETSAPVEPVTERNQLHQRKKTSAPSAAKLVRPAHTEQTIKKTNEQTSGSEQSNERKLVLLPDVPESLRTPEFLTAWTDWQKHRTEIKHKLTPTTASRQIKQCEQAGPAAAAIVINKSISNGWQGLFFNDQRGVNVNGVRHTEFPPSGSGRIPRLADRH